MVQLYDFPSQGKKQSFCKGETTASHYKIGYFPFPALQSKFLEQEHIVTLTKYS